MINNQLFQNHTLSNDDSLSLFENPLFLIGLAITSIGIYSNLSQSCHHLFARSVYSFIEGLENQRNSNQRTIRSPSGSVLFPQNNSNLTSPREASAERLESQRLLNLV